MPTKPQYMRETIASAIERVVNGESMNKVAKDIGCSYTTVVKWLDKYFLFKKGEAVETKQSKV